MILWELFWGFLKVGCFAFGGAYGAIPLIRDVVLGNGWLSDEALSHMIAVSESSPGPIMVNLATYVGSSQAGFWGSLLATAAVVLPSFLIIVLVTGALGKALKNQHIQAVLKGLKPCVIGIVLATGVFWTIDACIQPAQTGSVDCRAVLLAVLLAASAWGWKRWKRRKLSPIALILLSAALGILFYGV